MLFDAENTIVDGPDELEARLGQIRFEAVDFAYPDGHVALEDVSFAVEPGMRVAFVGRSGAGKSTVFNLLPRLYDPTGGRILIDGHDIRSLTLASLRDQIAVVSQDSVLLTGTVADNIGFGRRDASRRRDRGRRPGRRRRRLHPRAARGLRHRGRAVRRPVLRRRAPAPVDRPRHPARRADPACSTSRPRRSTPRARPLIRGALERLARGRTTLVIAHRLATVLDSDLIVVMDRGRIVEQGTPCRAPGARRALRRPLPASVRGIEGLEFLRDSGLLQGLVRGMARLGAEIDREVDSGDRAEPIS